MMTPPQPRAGCRRSRHLLPEDGIVDEVAVELAAAGTRLVALTATERRLAAARILAAGGSVYRVARRLGISWHAANALAASLTTSHPGDDAREAA